VAGSLRHEEVLRFVRPLKTKTWKNRIPVRSTTKENRISSLSDTDPSIVKSFGFHWMDLPAEQDHILLGIPAPACRSIDRMPTVILNLALGGGMSSYLFQEVREKAGLAYTVYSHYMPFQEVGLFTIYAGVTEGKMVPALKKIENSLKKLTSRALSKTELNSIKENLKASTLMSIDSVESRMMNIAQAELLLGEVLGVDKILKRIDAIRSDDILRVARRLFDSSRVQGVFAGPRRSKSEKENVSRQFYKSFPRGP
jgi:predicted Zn-dependent peptidase